MVIINKTKNSQRNQQGLKGGEGNQEDIFGVNCDCKGKGFIFLPLSCTSLPKKLNIWTDIYEGKMEFTAKRKQEMKTYKKCFCQ